MNRITFLFLALAILLAHTLWIHQTPSGEFAAPYEISHVAYRCARNLIRHGALAWNPGAAAVESYPSALWIGVCTVAEHRYLPPTLVTQFVGILCALGTVVVLTQFSPRRMAGLIAPMLLAASGSAAAAGASGTEAPLAMLLVTSAFLAFERGWRRSLAATLALLALTRPEGIFLVFAFLVLELFDRPIGENGLRRRSLRWWYVVPVVVVGAMAISRWVNLGTWLSPFGRSLLEPTPGQAALGLDYARSYLLSSGSAPLLLFPVVLLPLRWLSGTGRRALILSATWLGMVVLSGGDGLPFWNALAAVVPISLISVQEALRGWMDRRPRFAPVTWAVLVLATGASFLVSKSPGNIGPIPLERFQRWWMEPGPRLAEAYGRSLGRLGLLAEIREVERLRPLGVFLRDSAKEPSTIATFWPGAIAYLSRKEVYDLRGRAFPSTEDGRVHSWRANRKVDLVDAFEREAGYVVPLIGSLEEGVPPSSFLETWLRRFDTEGTSQERNRALVAALWRYELISVPVPDRSHQPDVPSTIPFLLLRSKDLGLTPTIELELEGGKARVHVRHVGHRQVVDLGVKVTGPDGGTLHLRPTGEWTEDDVGIAARTSILLYETGPRPILLLEADLPPDLAEGTVEAQLTNPGMPSNAPLAAVGSPALAPF